ncbi:MAG: hypothetical protein JKY61_01905 [Planctomycetes bacterium]|nr:hypothetical protein [Planctomycetota bacterium]
MKFEDMQVIWDSQKDQKMFALDHDALHRTLIKKTRCIELGVTANELGMIAICLFVAAEQLRDPLFDQVNHYKIFGGAVMVCVAIWMLLKRVARIRKERGFDDSLCGDLDRSISHVEYNIALARSFQWWFLVPALIIVVVKLYFGDPEGRMFSIATMTGASILAMSVVHLGLRCSQIPQKRDLESLRLKLTTEQ